MLRNTQESSKFGSAIFEGVNYFYQCIYDAFKTDDKGAQEKKIEEIKDIWMKDEKIKAHIDPNQIFSFENDQQPFTLISLLMMRNDCWSIIEELFLDNQESVIKENSASRILWHAFRSISELTQLLSNPDYLTFYGDFKIQVTAANFIINFILENFEPKGNYYNDCPTDSANKDAGKTIFYFAAECRLFDICAKILSEHDDVNINAAPLFGLDAGKSAFWWLLKHQKSEEGAADCIDLIFNEELEKIDYNKFPVCEADEDYNVNVLWLLIKMEQIEEVKESIIERQIKINLNAAPMKGEFKNVSAALLLFILNFDAFKELYQLTMAPIELQTASTVGENRGVTLATFFCKMLYDQRSDPSQKDTWEIFKSILEKQRKSVDFNNGFLECINEGKTAFWYIAASGEGEAFEYVYDKNKKTLDFKAKPAKSSKPYEEQGKDAFWWVCYRDGFAFVEEIVDEGYSIDIEAAPSYGPNAQENSIWLIADKIKTDPQWETILLKILEKDIHRKIDINYCPNTGENLNVSIFLLACEVGALDAVEYMLRYYSVNINIASSSRQSAFAFLIQEIINNFMAMPTQKIAPLIELTLIKCPEVDLFQTVKIPTPYSFMGQSTHNDIYIIEWLVSMDRNSNSDLYKLLISLHALTKNVDDIFCDENLNVLPEALKLFYGVVRKELENLVETFLNNWETNNLQMLPYEIRLKIALYSLYNNTEIPYAAVDQTLLEKALSQLIRQAHQKKQDEAVEKIVAHGWDRFKKNHINVLNLHNIDYARSKIELLTEVITAELKERIGQDKLPPDFYLVAQKRQHLVVAIGDLDSDFDKSSLQKMLRTFFQPYEDEYQREKKKTLQAKSYQHKGTASDETVRYKFEEKYQQEKKQLQQQPVNNGAKKVIKPNYSQWAKTNSNFLLFALHKESQARKPEAYHKENQSISMARTPKTEFDKLISLSPVSDANAATPAFVPVSSPAFLGSSQNNQKKRASGNDLTSDIDKKHKKEQNLYDKDMTYR